LTSKDALKSVIVGQGVRENMKSHTSTSRLYAVALILIASIVTGCAPKQLVPLHVSPEPIVLYLNGEAQKELPENLKLKADRDYTLFFRKEGYRPAMVVLRTTQVEGKSVLIPEQVEVDLERLRAASRPGLSLTVEDDE
jgi:hypothetical protein